MVILILDSDRIELDDELADHSTYIRGARSFSMTTTGKNEVDLRDISTYIGEYILFLQGKSFKMNNDVALLLEWMGHINPRSNKKKKRLKKWYVYLMNGWYKKYIHRCIGLDGIVEIDIVNPIHISSSIGMVAIVGQIVLYVIGMTHNIGHPTTSNTYYSTNTPSHAYIDIDDMYVYLIHTTLYTDKTIQEMVYSRDKEKEQIVYLPSQKKVYASHLTYYKVHRKRNLYHAIKILDSPPKWWRYVRSS